AAQDAARGSLLPAQDEPGRDGDRDLPGGDSGLALPFRRLAGPSELFQLRRQRGDLGLELMHPAGLELRVRTCGGELTLGLRKGTPGSSEPLLPLFQPLLEAAQMLALPLDRDRRP